MCVCEDKLRFRFPFKEKGGDVILYSCKIEKRGSLHANDSRVHLSSFARIMSIVGVLYAK